MGRLFLAFALILAVSLPAAASAQTGTSSAADSDRASSSGPVIDTIEFEGLRRIEPVAIRVLLSSRRGKPYSPAQVTEDIRAIFGMGFFDDVKAYEERAPNGGVKLIFELKEKPSVGKVLIAGNDELSDDSIKDIIDIRPFTVYSEAKVKRNAEKIKDLYSEKGYYLAEVGSKVEPSGQNQVAITFEIIENAKVEVRRIRFVGNKNLSDDTLKNGLLTQEGNLISFFTGAGTYRKDAFQVDLLRISSHYFDNGYINVKIDTPDVEISADRKFIYITIRIEEGEQYSVGKTGFSGELPDTETDWEKIKPLTQIRDGQIFNRSKLGEDLLALKTRYEDDGYAYANITPVTAIDANKRLIDITFDVQKGEKVYYERINVIGNTKTRDKVVRRELRIYEGELTSASLRDLSRRRVNALGYFEKVEMKTRKGSADNMQIVDVEIKEKATGTFQIGAGFSSSENFIATAQISQDNFLGRGQSVALSAQLSSLRQLFQLRFTEPYFFDTDWTFSFDAFNTETAFQNFQRSSTGGDLTFGHPITDDIRLFLTYTLEFVQSSGSDVIDRQAAYFPLNNSGRISSLRASVTYDTRDNRLFPSDGQYHSLSAEASAQWLGASESRTFQKFRTISRFYYPVFWSVVAKLSARAGFINSTSPQGLAPSEKFIMGGINTIRGYEPFSISPSRRVTVNDRGNGLFDPASSTFAFLEGGNKELLLNFEIEFPIFEAVGIKGVLFLDAGNVYGEDENFFYAGKKRRELGLEPDDPNFFDPLTLPAGLFWSVGFGFRWFSPIGPLRFEWGIPLTRRPTDETGPLFEFSIGNAF